MISILLIILFLVHSFSLQPSDFVKCKTCKWFINSKKKIKDGDGLCKVFSKIVMQNKKIEMLYYNASQCRKRENMCGKKGKLHMDIVEQEEQNEDEITKSKEINTEKKTEQITEEIINNNEKGEKIINMSKEIYDYNNFIKRNK